MASKAPGQMRDGNARVTTVHGQDGMDRARCKVSTNMPMTRNVIDTPVARKAKSSAKQESDKRMCKDCNQTHDCSTWAARRRG